MKTIVKLTLLFSACFMGVMLLLAHEFSVHSLSPRGLGIALALLSVGGVLIFALLLLVFVRKRAVPSLDITAALPLDPATRKQRIFFIRFCKGWIALLVLCLVVGLGRATRSTLGPTLVDVFMNLATTFALVWVVVRMQKTLN